MTDPYSTHQKALLNACFRTKGVILELGMGHYSTPILSEVSLFQQRQLISLEANLQWFKRFPTEHEYHQAFHIENWNKDCPILEKEYLKFSVVFVDHNIEQRSIDIARLANRAEIFVLHDTEDRIYRYETIYHLFKWRKDYTYPQNRLPATTLLSNVLEL